MQMLRNLSASDLRFGYGPALTIFLSPRHDWIPTSNWDCPLDPQNWRNPWKSSPKPQASLLAALDEMGKCRLVDLSKGEAEEICDTLCDSMWIVDPWDFVTWCAWCFGKNHQLIQLWMWHHPPPSTTIHHHPPPSTAHRDFDHRIIGFIAADDFQCSRLCARFKRRCRTCGLTSLKPRLKKEHPYCR